VHKQLAIFLIQHPNLFAARRQILAYFSMDGNGNFQKRQHFHRNISGKRNRRLLGVDPRQAFFQEDG
jgi:hypothetical protein